jgi:hypothetical protein
MTTFLIALMILLLAAIIFHVIGTVKDDGKTDRWEHVMSLLLTALVFVALGGLAGFINDTPTAMDVYEGKTEMKYNITIRGNDTIVDSTVVLKENK